MSKVAVYTIGCKVNQAESGELKMDLAESGHTICRDPAEADLCVVNTCTVTAESDRKCRKLIRWLGRNGAGAIVAAGCYAQVRPDILGSLPGVVMVIPNSLKEDWKSLIMSFLPDSPSRSGRPVDLRTRGFIKVQDGCDRFCSYCIVPTARGRERSRPPREVLEAAKRWLDRGTRELVFCGVNLGRYSWGKDYDLCELVKDVAALPGDFRIRLSSIELEDLKMIWLKEWTAMKKVCPHLHLPLQSGDEEVLQDMGRSYSPDDFMGAVRFMRENWPGAALTTEVIVGYPGESEDAFQGTLRLLETVRPSRIHVFRFSPRPGTRAWDRREMHDPVTAAERSARLRELEEEWRRRYSMERMGGNCCLLAEEIVEDGRERMAVGLTEDYMKAACIRAPVDAVPGSLIEGRIYGMKGSRVLVDTQHAVGA